MDVPALSQALRGALTLRDRVVVVHLESGSLDDAERLQTFARNFALVRTLGVRLLLVQGADADGRPDSVVPALIGALAGDEQKAVGILPHGAVRALPMVPFPIVDAAMFVQLTSLRIIPVVPMPVLDDAGKPAELTGPQVAAGIARFLDAAAVVYVHTDPSFVAPAAEGTTRSVAVAANNPDALLEELLLAPPAPGTLP